jgi:hypothetical protein
MPAPYDLTNASNMSGVTDLFVSANQLSGYIFGNVMLIVLWLIIFIQLKNYSSKPAMLVASFLTAVVAIFLFVLGMIGQATLMIAILLTAVAYVINWHGD